MLPTPRILLILLLSAPLLSVGRAAENSDPWHLAWEGHWTEARQQFEELVEANGKANRKTLFGLALSTIQEQPRTTARIARGGSLFQTLVDENPTDAIGIASRYQLIRLLHVYTLVPELEDAKRQYLELYKQHPEHFWGQQAFYRYLMFLRTDPELTDEDRAQMEWAESQIPHLSDPRCRRDCAIMMAGYYLRFEPGKRKALNYFNIAEATGMGAEFTFRDTYMSAAGTALDLEEWEDAYHYYTKFLDVVENDSRIPVIQERLAYIESQLSRDQLEEGE